MNTALRTLAAVAALFVASPAFAADTVKGATLNLSESRCSDLIKECFAYADVQRSDCFHAASKNSSCHATELGELAMKRWSMSPVRNPSLDSSPALLGPKVVDGDCIANFDNNWSGALVKEDISRESLESLDEALAACNRQMPVDMMRP